VSAAWSIGVDCVVSDAGPIGILGGTFDPIHFGHLRLAEEVADACKLGVVRFVPTAVPPHRTTPQVTAADRLEMTRLAIADNRCFTLDDRELGRAGPSYTFDTLTELRRDVGATRPICLLLGADAFLDLATWHRWHEIFGLAHLAVAHRPGFPVDSWGQRMPQPLAREYEARRLMQPLAIHWAPAGGIATVAITALDISATRIRDGLGKRRSQRYLIPESVLDYIRTRELYKEPDGPGANAAGDP
jgi:nicotinate-nucleotide adenylyltransferase